MKAIVELTPEEYSSARNAYTALMEKCAGMGRRDMLAMFEDLHICTGYAHYKFRGKVSETLIERLGRMPTEDEIIMLVEGGFSHFGATCTVQPDGTFSGRVNID